MPLHNPRSPSPHASYWCQRQLCWPCWLVLLPTTAALALLPAGACEYNPAGLNRTWFFPQPAKGQLPGDHWHAIYAASFKPTGTPFPLAWSPDDDSVPGVDVTQAYTDTQPPPTAAAGEGAAEAAAAQTMAAGATTTAAAAAAANSASQSVQGGRTAEE